VPPEQAAQVRDACARWRRLRFAIDATPYPRPDAECSPGRGHVHHDACRCDSTRKTIPGWEYQFTAAIGHLRTAWAALIDVECTTPATRASQTIRQVTNLLRRLHGAGGRGRVAPLVVFDAGYSAAALTAGLTGHPVHLLVRLATGQVLYCDPARWPGKNGRPGKYGTRVACHKASDPDQSNPEPDETLILPGTPRYGTVRADAWRGVHPQIHGDRGWFTGWQGTLPVLRASSCPARKQDWAGDLQVFRESGDVRVFVDQAAQDGFSADLLCVDVGHGGAGSVRFVVGDVLGDALVRPGRLAVRLVLG
jgi:hypothetical protein